MTPAEWNKSLTLLLHERLADTGFSKKRIGTLKRKTGDNAQARAQSRAITHDHNTHNNVRAALLTAEGRK